MKLLSSQLVLLLCTIALQACNTYANNQTKDNTYQKVTGHYIFGHEVNAFQPCNSTSAYWVTGSKQTLSHISNSYQDLTNTPYQKVYVVLSGKYLSKASDGFARDYEGLFQINQIIAIREASNSDCIK